MIKKKDWKNLNVSTDEATPKKDVLKILTWRNRERGSKKPFWSQPWNHSNSKGLGRRTLTDTKYNIFHWDSAQSNVRAFLVQLLGNRDTKTAPMTGNCLPSYNNL